MKSARKTSYEIIYRDFIITTGGYLGWEWVHPNFDGGIDEPGGSCTDHRCGTEETEQACKDAVDEWYELNG